MQRIGDLGAICVNVDTLVGKTAPSQLDALQAVDDRAGGFERALTAAHDRHADGLRADEELASGLGHRS